MNRLIYETDRGCVLGGCSFLETDLGKLLKQHLKNIGNANYDEREKLLKGPMAPFGTLYLRTRVAYALGLIDRNLRDALDAIRTIRNPFAHLPEVVQFQDDATEELITILGSYLTDDDRKWIDEASERGGCAPPVITWPSGVTSDYFSDVEGYRHPLDWTRARVIFMQAVVSLHRELCRRRMVLKDQSHSSSNASDDANE